MQALPHRGAVESANSRPARSQRRADSAFGDSFITLKDVEVRLFDDAVVLYHRQAANLPASYGPTMGTQSARRRSLSLT